MNILVLCTGNSCRSQMAEGYLRFFLKREANIYSAGIETHGVNPMAIKVMKEDKININQHTSNHVNEYMNLEFDHVITVCNHAKENCPYLPSTAKKWHQNFEDPAKAIGTEEEVLNSFRIIRDQIRNYCEEFTNENNL